MITISTHSQRSGTKDGKIRAGVFCAAALGAAMLFFGGATAAFAAVSITQATGGGAISADTNMANGVATWTVLAGPTVSEGSYRDFPSSGTFILNAPSGFSFNTGAAVTATISRYAGTGSCFSFTSTTATPAANTVTFTLNARDSGNNSTRCRVVFSNMQARPAAGTPLASGNIVKTGTASVSGITNGVTSLGTLTEVAGAASKLVFTTQPGSATYGSVLIPQPVVVSRDQFDNNSATGLGASKIVTLAITSGTGSLQGVVSLDIGTSAGNGTIAFSGLKVSAAGTGKAMTASASGLANAVSGAFTINPLAVVLVGTRTYDTTTTAASGILSVSNKVGTDDVFVASGNGTLASANAGLQSIASFGTLALGGTTVSNYTITGGSGSVTITKATPTLSITNSPVTYDGAQQSASVGGSVSGSVSNITYNGSVTAPVNAGTYAVTANFLPNDTTNYNSLIAASAGAFVITVANQSITFGALADKALGDPNFTVSATASSGLTVSFSSLTTSVCTASSTTVHLLSTGTCTIRASQVGDTNYNPATNVDQSFAVSAGPAAVLLLTNPGNMFAKTRFGYTVSREDASGNLTGTGTTTVYLYTTSTSSSEKFYDDSLAGSVITSVTILPGHSTANFWYYDETPGTYTITASDNATAPDGAAGITDATDSVTVMPVATKFVILPPTNGTVDAPIAVTVQAQEPDGSVDTNYQNDVTLNTSGSATGAGLLDIINGVGTKSISDTVAESVNLSLTDSQSTGLDATSTQSVVFAGGAIAQFTLNHPAVSVAGQRAAYTIAREDQYGNVSTQATSTVYLYSSSTGAHKKFYDAATGGNVITSVVIPDGQSSANVWYYDELPGTWSITASDNVSAPDGNAGINDAVDSHQVTAGAVATFLLNNPGNMTAGTRLGYMVTREDQFSNLVTSSSTIVYLYSNSTGSSTPTFYDAAINGNSITSISILDGQSSASVWYADSNVGTWAITASDNASAPDGSTGIADATDSVTVNAAPIVATRFVILPPTPGTVDAPIAVTVQAEDASGNLDTTYQNDVTLNTTGSVTGGGLVNIVNGVGTLSISDTVAQIVTLSLSDSQATGLDVSSTRSVTFAPGAVAQFALDNPGDVAAGTRIGYTVTRKDKFGNLVTSGATTAYLYSPSTGVNKKFYDAASGGSAITSVVISDGKSSANVWYYDEKAGSWLITASDNATAPDGAAGIADATDAITVQPAATAKFLLNDPGNMTAGTRLGYTVTRKDQFDNLVTTGVNLAYLYSSSTGTTTAFYSTSTGGAPTTFAIINDGDSSGDFWYYDQTPGTWFVTVSDSSSAPNGATGIQDAVDSVTVSAMPIVASRFVILPVSPVQVGAPATVTVEAQDGSGNIDTSIQSGVTILASGSATGAGLVSMVNGVGTKILRDTVAETISLSLSDTQNTNFDVSSTQNLTFSAVPIAAGAGGGYIAPIVVPRITGVQLSGRAFPGAQIEILAVSPQGTSVQGQTTAKANGSFNTVLTGIAIGSGAYGVVGADSLGRTTQTKVFNANYANRSDLLTLDAGLLSPTLGLVHPTVRRNDMIGFVGMAMPGYTISAQVDGKTIPVTASAAGDGSYKILFGTGALSLGSHVVRVRQISPSGTRSEYAPQKVFIVSSLFTPQTDFNQDGVINVQDWSIFLSRWNSAVPSIRLLDDLNGDGKVDVTDLSIFVRTLKK